MYCFWSLKLAFLYSFLCSLRYVTYWHSTEPSIKRCTCVNKQENSKTGASILEYHLDLWTWLNSVQMRTPTGSRWVSKNYIIRCHRRLESAAVSSSQLSLVPVAVGDRMPTEWEPAPERGLWPSATHGWAAKPRWGRSTAMVARRTLGQYVAVSLRLQLTSHT